MNSLYLKLEEPQPLDANNDYNGYEVVKLSDRFIIRRYKEKITKGHWKINPLDEKKELPSNKLLEELIQQVDDREVALKDEISPEVAGFLYGLWHS